MSAIGDYSACWPAGGSYAIAGKLIHGSKGFCSGTEGGSQTKYLRLTVACSSTNKQQTIEWNSTTHESDDPVTVWDKSRSRNGSNSVNKNSGVITYGITESISVAYMGGTPNTSVNGNTGGGYAPDTAELPSFGGWGSCVAPDDVYQDLSSWSYDGGRFADLCSFADGGSGSASEVKDAAAILAMVKTQTCPFPGSPISFSYMSSTKSGSNTAYTETTRAGSGTIQRYTWMEGDTEVGDYFITDVVETTSSQSFTLAEDNPISGILTMVESEMLGSFNLVTHIGSATISKDDKGAATAIPNGSTLCSTYDSDLGIDIPVVDTYSDPLPSGTMATSLGSGGGSCRKIEITDDFVSSSKFAECMAWRSLVDGESCDDAGNVVVGQWTYRAGEYDPVVFTNKAKVFNLDGCWSQNRQPLFILSPNAESPACGFCTEVTSKISQPGESQSATFIQHNSTTGGDAHASDFSTDPAVSTNPC